MTFLNLKKTLRRLTKAKLEYPPSAVCPRLGVAAFDARLPLPLTVLLLRSLRTPRPPRQLPLELAPHLDARALDRGSDIFDPI